MLADLARPIGSPRRTPIRSRRRCDPQYKAGPAFTVSVNYASTMGLRFNYSTRERELRVYSRRRAGERCVIQ